MESAPSLEGLTHEGLIEDKRVEQLLLDLSSDTLHTTSRSHVALVYLGVKPATYQEVRLNDEGLSRRDSKSYYDKRVKTLAKTIESIGLPHFRSLGSDITKFVIGGSIEEATALRDACSLPHSPERIREFGLAVGYPETAVDAYIKYFYEDDKDATLTPTEVGRPDLGRVEAFRLSKDHWKKELVYMEDADVMLKKYMPNLYEKVKAKR